MAVVRQLAAVMVGVLMALTIAACNHTPPPSTPMPVGEKVLPHPSMVDFCKRHPDEC